MAVRGDRAEARVGRGLQSTDGLARLAMTSARKSKDEEPRQPALSRALQGPSRTARWPGPLRIAAEVPCGTNSLRASVFRGQTVVRLFGDGVAQPELPQAGLPTPSRWPVRRGRCAEPVAERELRPFGLPWHREQGWRLRAGLGSVFRSMALRRPSALALGGRTRIAASIRFFDQSGSPAKGQKDSGASSN
jgi:hypothetical protein